MSAVCIINKTGCVKCLQELQSDNVLTLQTESLKTNIRLPPKGCGAQMIVKVCGPLILRT